MSSPGQLTRPEKLKLTRLSRDLVAWAAASGRDFPWRSIDATTYQKIAVEVLLQRTTATAVAGFYGEFFSRFPDWDRLAAATPEQLEEFLKPIGLWRRRATSLLGLARYAAGTGGSFPGNAGEHVAIPAVGQYVSNAILVFQHGKAAPLLDVNMARVIERVVRPRRLADIRHDPWLQAAANWFARGPRSAEVNWAVLDFAALVCKARKPVCDECPVSRYCSFFRQATPGLVATRRVTPRSGSRSPRI
jgi:A/G-specific adenine glycosylase